MKKQIVTVTKCYGTNEVLKKVINSIDNTSGTYLYSSRNIDKYSLLIQKGKSNPCEYTVIGKKITNKIITEIDRLLEKKQIDLLIIDIDFLDNEILEYYLKRNLNVLVSFPVSLDFSIDGMDALLIRQLEYINSTSVKGKLIGAILSEEMTLNTILQYL